MPKLPTLTAITTRADADVGYVVDVSDTTEHTSGSSKKITYANERAQSDLWLFPPNVAALATLGSTHADGDIVSVKGHVTDGDGGHGSFWLDKSGVSATANGGTIFDTDGSPANSYWRRLPDETEFDIRKWGGVVDIAAGNETANDLAFTNMIAAKLPVIFLPGPIVISAKIRIAGNDTTSIVGTNPAAVDAQAGGIRVTGAGTATTDCVIELENNQHVFIDNVRFFGHTGNPTTLCNIGIKLQSNDANIPPDVDHQTHTRIKQCVFENLTPDNAFVNCIKITKAAGEPNRGADQWTIEECEFHHWTEKCIWVDNDQAIAGVIRHCALNGGGSTFNDFADHGVYTIAHTSIEMCFFNRVKTCIHTNQANRLWVSKVMTEHCRTFLTTANALDQRIVIRDANHALQDDAYTDEVWATGQIYRVGSPARTIIVDSSGNYWTVTAGTGSVSSGNDSDLGGGSDPEHTYTATTSAAESRLINARCRHLVIEQFDLDDQLAGSPPRPHLRLGTHASATGPGLFRFVNCLGLTLDDIDGETALGLPAQRLRRLVSNAEGARFQWLDADTSEYIDTWLGINFLNLD